MNAIKLNVIIFFVMNFNYVIASDTKEFDVQENESATNIDADLFNEYFGEEFGIVPPAILSTIDKIINGCEKLAQYCKPFIPAALIVGGLTYTYTNMCTGSSETLCPTTDNFFIDHICQIASQCFSQQQ